MGHRSTYAFAEALWHFGFDRHSRLKGRRESGRYDDKLADQAGQRKSPPLDAFHAQPILQPFQVGQADRTPAHPSVGEREYELKPRPIR